MALTGSTGKQKGSSPAFPAKAVKIFLEHLGQSANVKEAAKKAEVCTTTVYRKRQQSEDFRIAWREALRECASRLETMLMEEALKAPSAKTSPAMLRAREAKNRLRFQLARHHRPVDGGNAKSGHGRIKRSRQEVTAAIRRDLERMRRGRGQGGG